MKETQDLAHHCELLHFVESITTKISIEQTTPCPAAIWPLSGGYDYPATAAHFAVVPHHTATMPNGGHYHSDYEDPTDDDDRVTTNVGNDGPGTHEVYSSGEEKDKTKGKGK